MVINVSLCVNILNVNQIHVIKHGNINLIIVSKQKYNNAHHISKTKNVNTVTHVYLFMKVLIMK